jgi:NAD(P)-dependent dehydrogenase (short-subunit alcohol dehydrogenase family)
MELKQHTFLITGGASGLGAASARRFVDRGAQVVIADLQQEAGRALSDELGASGRFVQTDVTDEVSVQAAIEFSVGEFGPLRGVVHTAGIADAARVIGRDGPHPLDRFVRVMEVNLVGTFNVVRLAAAAMAQNEPAGGTSESGERGVMITTTSAAAFDGQIGQAAYAASKGGVTAMILPIARDLARNGIRIVAIAPGLFDTPLMAGLPDKARESLEAQVPFPPRLGRPEEFASLAAQIVENPMINGTTIRLDGALRMGAK